MCLYGCSRITGIVLDIILIRASRVYGPLSIGFRNPIKLMAETAVYGNVCDLKDIDGGKGKGVSPGIHEISSNFFFNFTKVIYLIIPKESNEKRIKGPMVQGKMFLKWRTLISSFVKIFFLTFFLG